MNDKFYITTTLPYVNDRPHIGHVLEFIQADVIARYHRLLGEEVIFNIGTDEHGIKVYRKALEQRQDPQAFVNEYSEYFLDLKKQFNLSFTDFIRTTDPKHIAAAQEFWKICEKNGDIYKKNYNIKYCVGCELEKTESELVDGKCSTHPNLNIEVLEEENYFFRFSKYQKGLLKLYENPDFVLPVSRLNEIMRFVEDGLTDFSISRLKSKLPWGIAVPGDGGQVFYVWFDALINYISTLGWPNDRQKFEEFWGTKERPNCVQIAGKDNLRQQSAIWQAMLLSVGLPPSKQILIHGFITSEGQKMSKTVGNVIDPVQVLKKYGADPVRYYLLREIPSDEDGDFSAEKLEARYNGDLANNLGNLVSRVAKLIETKLDGELTIEKKYLDGEIEGKINSVQNSYDASVKSFRLHEAIASVWDLLTYANQYIDGRKPWAEVEPDHILQTLTIATHLLFEANRLLEPFLPETAEKINKVFGKEGNKFIVGDIEPLFPRLK